MNKPDNTLHLIQSTGDLGSGDFADALALSKEHPDLQVTEIEVDDEIYVVLYTGDEPTKHQVSVVLGIEVEEEEPSYALQVTTGGHPTGFSPEAYINFTNAVKTLGKYRIETRLDLTEQDLLVLHLIPDSQDYDFHDQETVDKSAQELRSLLPDLNFNCFSVQTN